MEITRKGNVWIVGKENMNLNGNIEKNHIFEYLPNKIRKIKFSSQFINSI